MSSLGDHVIWNIIHEQQRKRNLGTLRKSCVDGLFHSCSSSSFSSSSVFLSHSFPLLIFLSPPFLLSFSFSSSSTVLLLPLSFTPQTLESDSKQHPSPPSSSDLAQPFRGACFDFQPGALQLLWLSDHVPRAAEQGLGWAGQSRFGLAEFLCELSGWLLTLSKEFTNLGKLVARSGLRPPCDKDALSCHFRRRAARL